MILILLKCSSHKFYQVGQKEELMFWQSFGVAPRIFALKEVLTAPKVKKPPENNCRITTAIGDGAKSLSVV